MSQKIVQTPANRVDEGGGMARDRTGREQQRQLLRDEMVTKG